MEDFKASVEAFFSELESFGGNLGPHVLVNRCLSKAFSSSRDGFHSEQSSYSDMRNDFQTFDKGKSQNLENANKAFVHSELDSPKALQSISEDQRCNDELFKADLDLPIIQKAGGLIFGTRLIPDNEKVHPTDSNLWTNKVSDKSSESKTISSQDLAFLAKGDKPKHFNVKNDKVSHDGSKLVDAVLGVAILAVVSSRFIADDWPSGEAFDYLLLACGGMNGSSAVIRALRMATLSLAPSAVTSFNTVRLTNIRGSSEDSSTTCLITNPWYSYRSPWRYPCSLCAKIDGFRTPAWSTVTGGHRNETVTPSALRTLQPTLFRNCGSNVSLWDIQRHLASRPAVTAHTTFPVASSSVSYVTSLSDLARPDIIQNLTVDPNAHVLWSSSHYIASHLFRKLFPRPSFLPKDTAISRKKILVMDGQEVDTYLLDLGGSSTVMYMQSQGSREVRLSPRTECRGQCKTMSAHLRPSDLLLYRPDVWTMESSRPSPPASDIIGSSYSLALVIFLK